MNSIILSSLAVFCSNIALWFKESVVGKLFFKICGGISKSWENSVILGFLRKREHSYLFGSAAMKAFRAPFTACKLIKNKVCEPFVKSIQSSFICGLLKTYMYNFIALNTRFFGMIILSAGAAYTVTAFAAGGGISKIALIGMLIGALLLLTNRNVTDFLNNSAVIGFCKSCIGFKDLDLEVYLKDSTRGASRFVFAALVGLVSGAGAGIAGIYGALVPFAVFGVTAVMYAPIVGVFFAVFAAPIVPTMALVGLVLLTMLSLLVKALTHMEFKWRLDGVGAGILLLLAVLFISSVLSFSMMSSLKVWAIYLVFLGFYFVIVNTIKSRGQLYALLKVLVISAALVALYGIMQYLFGWTTSNAWIDETMFEDSTMRVYSTLGNPNVLGEYLLLVLPMAAVWFLKLNTKTLAKWVYGAMFLVLALCLVLTQSRGCWIGFMLSAVVFVTFYEGKWWGLLPIAVCIIPFVIPETMVDRFLSIGNMADSSTSYRVYIWLGTLGMLKHYWLGGIGMGEGAFNEVYPFFSYNAIQAPHSHNLYLQLTVEAGVGALLVFIVTQIIFFKKTYDVYSLKDKKSMQSATMLALASGILGFLAQSMFDYTFYNYRVMAVFFMVMAIAMTFSRLNEEGGAYN
ncbi:MAG: O-antigen ligase family protein [Firmicutes bacterium]|nr:O-antigen ligase family protein [Bacillota bacterium]